MAFDPKALSQPTAKTLLFIAKTERTPVIFVDGDSQRTIRSEFESNLVMHWKSKHNRVFIWTERIHVKKTIEGKRMAFNHYMHRYFLVPVTCQIQVLPSKSQYDFGYHRVKQSLLENNAIEFLTVTEEDIVGKII